MDDACWPKASFSCCFLLGAPAPPLPLTPTSSPVPVPLVRRPQLFPHSPAVPQVSLPRPVPKLHAAGYSPPRVCSQGTQPVSRDFLNGYLGPAWRGASATKKNLDLEAVPECRCGSWRLASWVRGPPGKLTLLCHVGQQSRACVRQNSPRQCPSGRLESQACWEALEVAMAFLR